MFFASLAIAPVLYALGLRRLWRTAGRGTGVSASQAAAFGLGWLALAVALSPPMAAWSEASLAAHMVQHELLMVVAAPLVALSDSAVVMLWALPARARRTLATSGPRSSLRTAWRTFTSPLTVFVLHAAALWVWHLPRFYEAALGSEAIHAAQHLSFFGTAALFWWGLTHGRYGRVAYGSAVLYVFATTAHSGLLGALLTLAPRVLYAWYATGHPGGLTPLEDQQLAGLLMWVPAGLLFVGGGLVFFAAWLREADRRARLTQDRDAVGRAGVR